MNLSRVRIAHNISRPWHLRVDEASSVAEVVEDVQKYMASLTPGDLARLPASCMPEVDQASDIDYWSMRLADACKGLWGTNQDGEILTEVSQIFHHAAIRLSRIQEDRARRVDNN